MSEHDDTPLMRQYREIKRGYPDAILLFRVGDFYEMFYDDAVTASKLLAIALTSRDKSSTDRVPLCGVPFHAAQGYIAKLLKAGHTVALCEQVEDPKLAKGLVRREVVRLYTPGTLVDTEFLAPGESNYLAAISRAEKPGSAHPVWGLSGLDVSTGDFWVAEFEGEGAEQRLLDELARLEPRELLYAGTTAPGLSGLDRLHNLRLCGRAPDCFDSQEADHLLRAHFGVQSLDGLADTARA